ncbi:MAG TPA: hypothetical protein ENI34_09255 [candidate division WOR-3 bacterium]|uniref:Bacterial transcriptional activator domain-containing protein n=1 Tax=candidate division WOR-3 bacterium TaxID=2052148 RepID=A0A9C9ENP8_UNCW3|nr:hypothetical protein [candidate division WOR-3 bacterium]
MKKEFLFRTTGVDEPFVGRKKELKWLKSHLEETLNYNGRFILVRGEVGVGKTSFLERFIDEVDASNIHILYGRVLKDETKPFSPFIQMVKDHLLKVENRRWWFVKFLNPEIAPYFIHLIPELKRYYPLEIQSLEHPIDNRLFFYSFQTFFDNLSNSKPLILLLDDIQWMGDESTGLLKYIIRRMVGKSILIVATMTTQNNNQLLKIFIDELNNEHLISYLDLPGLSGGEIMTILNQMFGSTFAGSFTHWLFSVTRGNPLFIKEIVKTFVRQNIIFYDETKDRWFVETDYESFPVPETVESIIGYRIYRLSDSELKFLRGAAVIGEIFELPILRKLLNSLSDKQFLRSLNVLSASGLIEDSGNAKQFTHPLIRSLFYNKMNSDQRRRLHRRLARILKKNRASSEEIAFHLIKDIKPAEETERLAVYLFNTARRLFDDYQYLSAQRYLNVAQRIADKKEMADKIKLKIKSLSNQLFWFSGKSTLQVDDIEKNALELEVNNLRKDAGIHYRLLFHKRLSLQDLSKAEEDINKAITLVKKNDRLYWTLLAEHCLLLMRKGLLKEAEDEAKRLAVEIPQDKAPEARYKVFLYLGSISMSKGDLNKAFDFMLQAKKIAEDYHLLFYLGDSYSQLGLVEMRMGKVDSALIRFYESLKRAKLLQKEQLVGVDLLYMGYCFLVKGEYQRAKEFFEKAESKAKRIGNQRLDLTARLSFARLYLELNDVERAETALKQIDGEKLEINSRCDMLIYKSMIYLKKNEIDHALKFVNKSLTFAEKHHFNPRFARALAQKAQVLLKKGRRSEALKLFEKAKEILSANGEVLLLTDIFVRFGLAIGGTRGEAIFLQGLELLFEMRATPRISELYKQVRVKKFNNAVHLIHERLKEFRINSVEITTFGGLSVKKAGDLEEITRNEWQSRKAQELLALLLVQPRTGGITREILISYLWSDMAKKKSQANFRVILARLNKVIGGNIVIQKGPFLSLNRELLKVDFWEFESLVKEWRNFKRHGKLHLAEDRAHKAVALYRGDFLPEFYTRSLVDKQFELKERMREILFWLAMRCMERIEWQKAISFARRLLSFDANDEQACRIMMEALYNQGNRTGAIRQFHRLEKSLKEELNTVPAAETFNLYKRITNEE